MAIDLKKRTSANMTLRIVSVHDSAIDWNGSYANQDIAREDDESVEEAKKRMYRESHDDAMLAWNDQPPYGGDEPTVFVFRHPRIAEVREAIQGKLLNLQGVGGKQSDPGRIAREVLNAAFIGTAAGIGGEVSEAIRQKNRLPEDYIQALIDASVLDELSGAVLSAMNETSSVQESRQKKS
jgi:hypothetical protein